MRITIVTGPWLPVPAIAGGAVNRRWQGVAEEFAAQGHQVTICCRAYPGQPSRETIEGVQYIRRGGMARSNNIYWDLLKDLIYALHIVPTLPRADILVLNDFWLPIFAPIRTKVGKIVVNAARVPKGQYRFYTKVNLFVAVSRAVRDIIIQQCPSAVSRTITIPNPIDTGVFSPPVHPRQDRTEKEIQEILYIGRIHPEKGIELLIEAFALLSQSLPTVKLKIVGPFQENQGGGGKAYFDRLKCKAQGLAVEFCDPIFDINQLVKFYHQADIFCYPSLADRGESFGLAPLEAMATGLVPIVSNLDCFRDFITEGKTGYFFDHRSSNAAYNLSEILKKALNNCTKNNTMSENASIQALRYSYTVISRSYLEKFHGLLFGEY